MDRATQEGKQLAAKALKSRREMAQGSEIAADKAIQEKKTVSQTPVDDDDDDDWGDSGKGKGKKKGKGKAKGKGKVSAGQASGNYIYCLPSESIKGIHFINVHVDGDTSCLFFCNFNVLGSSAPV